MASDSYEDLIDLGLGQASSKQRLMCLSTILPTIAEWYAIIGNQENYSAFRNSVMDLSEEINFQLWYPDQLTEGELYKKNAANDTGTMCTSIDLPENIETLRKNMREWFNDQATFPQLSCVKYGFFALGLVASRHFRTPVIPAYWQKLVPNPNVAPDGPSTS